MLNNKGVIGKLFVWFSLFLFLSLGYVEAQPQKDTVVIDSTGEDVIYVDETLYLAPDTIKLTDTIVDYLTDARKNVLTKQEMGIYCSPYSSGLFTNNWVSDSVSVLKIVIYELGLRWQCYVNKTIFNFSLGYKKVNEQLLYTNNYHLTSTDISGVYDSILLKSAYTIKNYYNYFNISLGVGHHWDLHKFGFSLNAFLTAGILMNNSDYVANADAAIVQLRKNDITNTPFSIGLQPDLAYKLTTKINLHLSLNYGYSLNNSKKYPAVYLHTVAVSGGFSFFL